MEGVKLKAQTQIFLFVTLSLNFLHVLGPAVVTKACQPSQLKYVYTECHNNARWRVQVPNETCSGGAVEFPVPGKKCDINCPSGQYLDVEKNDCSNCLAGTYSLGSGVRFDMWTAGLPDGFTSSADRLDTKDAGSCSRARWKTMGSYLSGQSDNNCQLSLTYTVNVVSSGSVTFLYQYRSELEFFAFEVQNGLCESVSSREDSGSPLLDETDRNEIKRHTVPLKVGMNVLRWQIVPVADRIRPSGSSSASKSSSIIAIHSIEVSGIPYVYSCQSCHPGYSSAIGAPKCSKCQANTYSTSGQSCQACPAGQYSGPGAASCKPKPACAASDYALFYAQSPCTVANNYQVTRPSYNWIQPKVCDAGVSLPSNSGGGGNGNLPASCKGVYCNPGTRAAAANDEKDPLQCEACPEGQYSDGNSTVCQPCPAKTQVVHEYVASNWLVTPPLMNLSCLVLQVDGSSTCSEQAWQLMGDRVQTAPTRTRHSRVLTLDLPGFHQPQGAQQGDDTSASFAAAAAAAAAADVTPVGSLIIDFEVTCDTRCRLFLLKYESRRHVEIKTWAGSQKRSQFKYIIRRTDRHKFFLIFEPAPFIEDNESAAGSAASTGESVDWSRNVLTVYSVRAPNALGSGGVRCQACPLGIQGNKCIPCPAGKYYDSKNITCYPCPTGQVVAKHPAEGVNSCAPCPAGMRALDGVACVLNPKGPKQSDHLGGPEFDFTNLLSPGQYYLARGAKLFTGRGNQYTHVYNVSLTAGTKAKCESNATKLADKSVESFVCRVTIVPNHGNSSLTLAALPNSFADRLVNATNSEQSPGAEAMLKASGWKSDPDKMDTHIFFESDYTTEVCSKHRVTLVTLRCDPKAATPRLSLPPNCPDGTCDGCNFHLLMEAKEACKLCQTKDYERVNGECVMGKQTVHMYPPKRCYLPGGEPTKKTQVVDCPLVNKPVGIVMVVVLFIGFLSLALACHCYRKNKTLQYKYMQLVESKEGELPGVESCAVHEGDDEDDDDNRFRGAGNDDGELDVSVRGGRRSGGGGAGGSAVLSKLKRSILPSAGGRRDRGGGSNVEHLNLTEQMDDLSL